MKHGFENLPDISAKHNEIHRRAFIDYEEGDWTAGFTCGTSGTITINNSYKTGHYVKNGKMVTVTGYFKVNSVSSPVGSLTLTGLPFTCGNADKFSAGIGIVANDLEVTATTAMMGWVIPNTTTIRIYHYATGFVLDLAADIKADSTFWISATYFKE